MNKIKFYRLELGLSQQDLGEASQLRRWKVALIESGIHEPTSFERAALSRALGVQEASLFGFMGSEKLSDAE